MTPDEERAYLTEVLGTIADATGELPRGWLGPGLAQPDIWLTTSDEIADYYQKISEQKPPTTVPWNAAG
jgi:hypothetical protein